MPTRRSVAGFNSGRSGKVFSEHVTLGGGSVTPQSERRNRLAFVLVIGIAVVAMLIVSSIIDRLAPPGEPLFYTAGAGIVVGLLMAAVVSAVRRRGR